MIKDSNDSSSCSTLEGATPISSSNPISHTDAVYSTTLTTQTQTLSEVGSHIGEVGASKSPSGKRQRLVVLVM